MDTEELIRLRARSYLKNGVDRDTAFTLAREEIEKDAGVRSMVERSVAQKRSAVVQKTVDKAVKAIRKAAETKLIAAAAKKKREAKSKAPKEKTPSRRGGRFGRQPWTLEGLPDKDRRQLLACIKAAMKYMEK